MIHIFRIIFNVGIKLQNILSEINNKIYLIAISCLIINYEYYNIFLIYSWNYLLL